MTLILRFQPLVEQRPKRRIVRSFPKFWDVRYQSIPPNRMARKLFKGEGLNADANPGRPGTSNSGRHLSIHRATLSKRRHAQLLSRCVICFVVAGSLGGLFFTPTNGWAYAIDVLVRSYLAFVGTVMAHEGSHGLLGRSRAANCWWGSSRLGSYDGAVREFPQNTPATPPAHKHGGVRPRSLHQAVGAS